MNGQYGALVGGRRRDGVIRKKEKVGDSGEGEGRRMED